MVGITYATQIMEIAGLVRPDMHPHLHHPPWGY